MMQNQLVPSNPRRRILISAFACEPYRGSEQEVGWRWAFEMSRWYDVTVITQTRNRPGIDRELARGLPPDRMLYFEYVQLAVPLYRLKSRFDLLTWPYYALWQRAIIKVAARLHAKQPFALAHHVTFVSFRVPVGLKALGIPVVLGPVGGADQAPFHLLGRGFGPGLWCKEVLRNLLTGASEGLMRVLPPLNGRQGICLAATPAMEQIFKRAELPSKLFPAVGIDSGPERSPRVARPTRFLFVGRFHPLKGTHLLLEAFSRAAILGARLTLIGAGGEEASLHRLAAKLGIADLLEWTGKLPRNELIAHYRAHDALIAPSLYESGGLVALEAMAQGLPVIALDVGGHSVSIAEGCGLRISPYGSIDAVVDRLAAAMKVYADDPIRMETDGRNARAHVSSHYEWDNKAIRMKQIYEDLLPSHDVSINENN
jgi:glycosyltransferase involved in cell wall biosynthesis